MEQQRLQTIGAQVRAPDPLPPPVPASSFDRMWRFFSSKADAGEAASGAAAAASAAVSEATSSAAAAVKDAAEAVKEAAEEVVEKVLPPREVSCCKRGFSAAPSSPRGLNACQEARSASTERTWQAWFRAAAACGRCGG